MTLAMRLRQAGHEVTLFESAPELGGLASAWTLGDVVWDKHYHVILTSDSYLRRVLDELGLDEEINWVETRTGCYAAGELYSVSNPIEFLRFPPLRLVDKARLAWTILYGSRLRDWRALEQIPVEEWLVRHSGRRTFETFWKPLLRAKLGDNYRLASAAFIWAIIQRLFSARRSGIQERFGYVEGGYARILERFGDHLERTGVDIRLGARVERIGHDGSAVLVTSDGESDRFDRVVATPASPIAAQLIDGLEEEERRRMEGITYQGIVCASLLLSHPLADFYVTNITDDWVPFTGVIEMTSLVDRRVFDGNSLVYLPRYTTQDDEFWTRSDEEVRESFVAALERMYPGFDRSSVLAFRVSRVRYVLPVSTLGYSAGVPTPDTSVPGVYAINSAQILQGTLNVNETIQLAERAMDVLVGGAVPVAGTSEHVS